MADYEIFELGDLEASVRAVVRGAELAHDPALRTNVKDTC